MLSPPIFTPHFSLDLSKSRPYIEAERYGDFVEVIWDSTNILGPFNYSINKVEINFQNEAKEPPAFIIDLNETFGPFIERTNVKVEIIIEPAPLNSTISVEGNLIKI